MAAQRDPAWVQAMQEARRSSATTPQRNKTKYSRRRKHAGRNREE
jgi:hypothetical protein